MYILFMLSNAFIKALHVKQIYKLTVKPAAGNCWLTTQSFLSKMRQAERDLLRISERGFWHKAQCFCGVLTAAWGSWASSQPPSYKAGPTRELCCTSHLEHRPSFPSCFRRRNLQTPTYTFWLLFSWVQLAWQSNPYTAHSFHHLFCAQPTCFTFEPVPQLKLYTKVKTFPSLTEEKKAKHPNTALLLLDHGFSPREVPCEAELEEETFHPLWACAGQ